MTTATPLRILEVQASARSTGSISRDLTADLIAALEDRHGKVEVTQRDLTRIGRIRTGRFCRGRMTLLPNCRRPTSL
jgi:hypothetical protein